jgi:hypothetical protein
VKESNSLWGKTKAWDSGRIVGYTETSLEEINGDLPEADFSVPIP